jgi:hypothetical protein
MGVARGHGFSAAFSPILHSRCIGSADYLSLDCAYDGSLSIRLLEEVANAGA